MNFSRVAIILVTSTGKYLICQASKIVLCLNYLCIQGPVGFQSKQSQTISCDLLKSLRLTGDTMKQESILYSWKCIVFYCDTTCKKEIKPMPVILLL